MISVIPVEVESVHIHGLCMRNHIVRNTITVEIAVVGLDAVLRLRVVQEARIRGHHGETVIATN